MNKISISFLQLKYIPKAYRILIPFKQYKYLLLGDTYIMDNI